MRISDLRSDVCSSDLFDTVEINASFYRLPKAATFTGWCKQAPPGFCYAVKAPRFITHMHKLKDVAEPMELFLGNARHLGRSEEHTSELQSLMRISYAVFCLKKKKTQNQ